MAEKNMNAKISVEFEETANRQQLSSGDNLPTLFGKIKKIISDLSTSAFSGSYNDLSDIPIIDDALSTESTNPIQNKAVAEAINNHIHTYINDGFSAFPLDSTVILHWKPVEGADQYRIQRYNDETSMWSTIVYPSSSELSYCDTGLTNDTTYRYCILYRIGEEWIHIGNEISVAPNDMNYNIKGDAGTVNGHTVEADVPADAKFTDTIPEIPTSLPANGGNADTINKGFMAVPFNGAVILYWNKIDGAEEYRIQRRLESNTSLSTITYPSATTFSYCDTGVTNGTTYVYRLLYAVGNVWTTVADVTVHPSTMTYTAPKATAQSDTALTPTTSCLRQLASGTADPTTTTCPEGAWYGKHV